MSNNRYEYESGKLAGFAKIFNRTDDVPLERSQSFDSYEDALAYAKCDGSDYRKIGKTAWVGQPLSVIENGVVSFYVVNQDKGLTPLLDKGIIQNNMKASEKVEDFNSLIITEPLNGSQYDIILGHYSIIDFIIGDVVPTIVFTGTWLQEPTFQTNTRYLVLSYCPNYNDNIPNQSRILLYFEIPVEYEKI